MEPILTSELIPVSLEDPVAEIQDFDRVVQVYWPRILRFILASVRDRDIAEMLTQDCFWNAYRGRKSFRGDSSLHTWLMRIAVNSIRKFLRNRRLQFWRRVQESAIQPVAYLRKPRLWSMSRFGRSGMQRQACPNGKGQYSCFALWKT